MRKNMFKLFTCGLVLGAFSLTTSCSSNDEKSADPINPETTDRWITVSGALMQENPGDGNGGTIITIIMPI
ncbi:hypothetical protein ACHRVW_08505 [Flavobacterium collinsii]|uniref:hypothetical protein n=1 Tax=Flavobacterium collinsii TaxID=1114861 RepID=UPI003757CD90